MGADHLSLQFDRIFPANTERGFSPYYHFRIFTPTGDEAGHINFRIGDTPHLHRTAGHIGFVISPQFRGHNFAYHACNAIAPFVKTLYNAVIITCDPHNTASQHIIEKLNTTFIDQSPTTPTPTNPTASIIKRRYRWIP